MPLVVELTVLGQAALGHVETEIVAGLDPGHAAARAALGHLGQRTAAARCRVHLRRRAGEQGSVRRGERYDTEDMEGT